MSDLKKKFDAASASVKKAKKDPGNDMKLKISPTTSKRPTATSRATSPDSPTS